MEIWEIGRGACRGRGENSGVAGSLKKKKAKACGGRNFFFFSSRRRHTRSDRDWSSDVCSSDLTVFLALSPITAAALGVALLGEPVTAGMVAGVMCVAAGLWVAGTGS